MMHPGRLVSALKKNRLARGAAVNLVLWRNLIRLRTLKTPPVLFVFITSRCNLRCRHCFYWKNLNSSRDMQLDEFRKIIGSLKNRLETLVLTGGEPTLHPELRKFVDSAAEINRPRLISIPTNGMAPGQIGEIAGDVCRRHPKIQFEISISLDGLAEHHDEVRGFPGAFANVEKTVEGLKEIKSRLGLDNLGINIVTTVGEYNYRQLDHLFFYVQSRFQVNHKIQLVRASSTGVFGSAENVLSGLNPRTSVADLVPQFKEMKASLLDLSEKYSFPAVQRLKLALQLETIENHGNRLKCVAGVHDGIIYENGDVSVCEMLKPLGNLADYDYDFSALWTSAAARRFVRSLHCSCVHNCNIVSNMLFDRTCLRRIWRRY